MVLGTDSAGDRNQLLHRVAVRSGFSLTTQKELNMNANIGNLVLSRKKAESIMIGDIELIVVSIDGNRVKIAIKCDKNVRVLRGELVGDEK